VEGSRESEGDLEEGAPAEDVGETFSPRAFIFALHADSREGTRGINKTDILEAGARLVGPPKVKRVEH